MSIPAHSGSGYPANEHMTSSLSASQLSLDGLFNRMSIPAHSGSGYPANEHMTSSLSASQLSLDGLFNRMSIPAHSGSGYTANEHMTSSLFPTMLSSRPQIDRSAEQGPTPSEVQYCELYQRCPRLLIALSSCSSVLPSL
jgi:hypothetical protein